MKTLRMSIVALATASGLLLAGAACAPPAAKPSAASSTGAATATSAADVGGMDALVAAAKTEGALNVIALPPDWANYGKIIDGFKAKYGITVNSAQPEGSSQEEINAATQLKGTDRAPDVFDLSQSVALANTAMFAPYKVSTFDSIGSDFKDAGGTWVNDYGGYMSIGYDSSKVPTVKTVEDLLGSGYRGKVALNGNPVEAGAAFSGVVMVAVANGGSADDIQPGIDFFGKLKQAGNFLPLDPTSATIESGQTPLVIDWDYTNAAVTAKLPSWKVVVPENAQIGGYYYQAISKEAKHPAAARLWEEYLYSDEGQNLYLGGGARPVRADDMQKAGTLDAAAYARLPKVSGSPVLLSAEQNTKAAALLKKDWAKVTG